MTATIATAALNEKTVTDQEGRWRVTLDPMAADKLTSVNDAPEGRAMVITFTKDGEKAETLVPSGVINAAVGGSKIETWLNQQPYETGTNDTTIIAILIHYGMRGVIWYQGESNARDGDGSDYLAKLTALINGWRQVWDQPDSKDQDGPRRNFSFYYVQLPGIGESDKDKPEMGDGRAGIRRAYRQALQVENTGMAVCHDIGAKGEHPPNKYDTGIRLAQLALHHDYEKKDFIPSGPLAKSHTIEGNAIRKVMPRGAPFLDLMAATGNKIEQFLRNPPGPTHALVSGGN